jgi:hypothetical protein
VILAEQVDAAHGLIAGLTVQRGDETDSRPEWKMIATVANLTDRPVSADLTKVIEVAFAQNLSFE